jgi:serine/threonine-protein kinase
MSSPQSALGDSVRPGDVLAGKYRVTRVIGRGGMGVIVEAEHAALRERVAIKVLHPRYAENAEAVARFHHEARAAVRVRGEHSVRLLDVGSAENGAPFLVMELLEGRDLASLLATGRLAPTEAVLLTLQACEGMAEVHAAGIVHRDLKPANLFVAQRPDGSPLVKVLDFGVAKGALPAEEQAGSLTMTLVALGTPLYMAPEQVRSSRDVDARADIWSLGAILYEMLAGVPAFGGNTVANITAQVLEADPRPLTTVAPSVPAELDRVVRKALAKRPEQRFVDVAAFAAALSTFAGDEGRAHAERAARILRGDGRMATTGLTVTAPVLGPDTLTQTAMGDGKSSRERRIERGLFALTAVLLVASLGIGWRVVDTLRARAAVPRLVATKGVARAAAVRGTITVTAARLVPVEVELGDAPTAPASPEGARATPTQAAAPRPKPARTAAPDAPPAPTAKPVDAAELLSTRK